MHINLYFAAPHCILIYILQRLIAYPNFCVWTRTSCSHMRRLHCWDHDQQVSSSIKIQIMSYHINITSVSNTIHIFRGWEDMSNFTKEFQQPFQLYREGGSTYLQVWTHCDVAVPSHLVEWTRKENISDTIFVQWMGQESLHQALEGRLLLVHLLCKVGLLLVASTSCY